MIDSWFNRDVIDQRKRDWMVWTNAPLALYHGTVEASADDIQQNGINLAICLPSRDFGRGFYVTRRRGQALQFARAKYRRQLAIHTNRARLPHPGNPFIVEFLIDRDILGSFDTLAFVRPTDDWSEFVQHCRQSGAHKLTGNFYDVVYGPISTLRGTAYPQHEQLSFHTPAAIAALTFVRTQRVGP